MTWALIVVVGVPAGIALGFGAVVLGAWLGDQLASLSDRRARRRR